MTNEEFTYTGIYEEFTASGDHQGGHEGGN